MNKCMTNSTNTRLITADCLEEMKSWPDNHVDLTFGSPPYENARTYGIDFGLTGQDWVDWMFERIVEMVRVTSGLVAMVVEGRTKKFRYSATPILLMADLHRAGIHLRKPPAYRRVGIPGSGGPDWLRNDYEFVICATSGGKLPWSDNTAMGHPPKFPPGGNPSHQSRYGRVNRPRLNGKGNNDVREYKPPVKANPGNVIDCHGGGGHMGSELAHENEAPLPGPASREMRYNPFERWAAGWTSDRRPIFLRFTRSVLDTHLPLYLRLSCARLA